jgi:hypothetical protein
MKKIAFITLCIFLVGILINSCKKNEEITINDENVTSIDAMIELYNNSYIEELTVSNKKSFKCHCPELIFHPNEDCEIWPLSFTLDYGEEGCEYPVGFYCRGQIHTTLTDVWMNEGSVHSIEFENYYVNDINLLGTKTITNTGLNDEENPTWEIKIIDGGVKDTLGNEKTLNATLYKEIVEGADTWTFEDNVCEITGSGSGTDNGVGFTAEITVPLRYEYGCLFPVSGEMTITIGSEVFTINYGEGECDDTATMQIGDNDPQEITLGFN